MGGCLTPMPDRYPGYDVLAKRNTPSWNRKTREVIDRRLAVPHTPRFFTEDGVRDRGGHRRPAGAAAARPAADPGRTTG